VGVLTANEEPPRGQRHAAKHAPPSASLLGRRSQQGKDANNVDTPLFTLLLFKQHYSLVALRWAPNAAFWRS
jgi:hypothetical protein